jgi:membrane protease YdiL (CAAX protease family)
MEPLGAARGSAIGVLARGGGALELALFLWSWRWCGSLAARVCDVSAAGAVHGLDYLRWALLASALWTALVALALRVRGRGAAAVGAARPRAGWTRALGLGLALGGLLWLAAWGVQALALRAGLSADTSTFEIASTPSWLGFLAGALLAGAFGEELVYRGYLLERFERLLDGLVPATWATRAAVTAAAALFAASHAWQGGANVAAVFVIGLGLGFACLRSGRNLAVPVVAHGVLDVVALTSLHLSA